MSSSSVKSVSVEELYRIKDSQIDFSYKEGNFQRKGLKKCKQSGFHRRRDTMSKPTAAMSTTPLMMSCHEASMLAMLIPCQNPPLR
jgi:hypothetical protein